MTAAMERRVTRGTVELRAGTGTQKRAGGYGIVFNKLSQNLGGFVERVDPGFPDATLRDGLDVLGRYQHDSNMLLGRTSSGTLRLAKDGTGLDYEADLPDTSYARDLAVLLERGDVTSSSFAFRVAPEGDEWGYTDQGYPLRTLLNGIVADVAPVVTPAYPDASAGLRSLAERRSLDPAVVMAAAEHNQLGELLRSGDPKVIDLGAKPGASPVAVRARLARARAGLQAAQDMTHS